MQMLCNYLFLYVNLLKCLIYILRKTAKPFVQYKWLLTLFFPLNFALIQCHIFIGLIVCALFTTVFHLQEVGSLQFPSDLRNVTRLPRNCEETVNSTKLNTSDNNVQGHTTHVCSRHLSMETAAFRCYSYNNSTLNFRAILRGLQRKSLKFKQISLITFQQYVSSFSCNSFEIKCCR